MGKKSKTKLLRRIAAELPKMQEQAFTKKIVSGFELASEKREKDAYDPSKNYLQRNAVVAVPVNHTRRMKKLAKQYGMNSAVSYALMVQKRHQAELEILAAKNTQIEKAP